MTDGMDPEELYAAMIAAAQELRDAHRMSDTQIVARVPDQFYERLEPEDIQRILDLHNIQVRPSSFYELREDEQ